MGEITKFKFTLIDFNASRITIYSILLSPSVSFNGVLKIYTSLTFPYALKASFKYISSVVLLRS